MGGFPDTDQTKAIEYYDKVVRACNQPLNAILWVVKKERAVPTLLSQYEVLMKEFKRAAPPLILIVNGQECYEDDDERQEQKEKDLQASFDFGVQVLEQTGLSSAAMNIIAGAEKKDLKGRIKNKLAVLLQGTLPK